MCVLTLDHDKPTVTYSTFTGLSNDTGKARQETCDLSTLDIVTQF